MPTTMTREELLVYLAGQFAAYAEETGVAITDDQRTFRYVLNEAFAYGNDSTTVQTLAIYHALKRFQASYLNAEIAQPSTLEGEIATARQAVADLPFDPPLSV